MEIVVFGIIGKIFETAEYNCFLNFEIMLCMHDI
jgi:hypothetical protein